MSSGSIVDLLIPSISDPTMYTYTVYVAVTKDFVAAVVEDTALDNYILHIFALNGTELYYKDLVSGMVAPVRGMDNAIAYLTSDVTDNITIATINPDGTLNELFVFNVSVYPDGIAAEYIPELNKIYIAYSGYLDAIDLDSGTRTSLASISANVPRDLGISPLGNIVVCSVDKGVERYVVSEGRVVTEYLPVSAAYAYIAGSEKVVLADIMNNVVYIYENVESGAVTTTQTATVTEAVTETVTEALPVPVEETVTETVTTTVTQPVIGTEAFIAILFILLIAAVVMLYSRSR